MKSLIYLASFSFLILLASCEGTEEQYYYWDQTQCADPWEMNSSAKDKEIESAVTTYLNSENITVSEVTVERNELEGMVCAACTCPSGNVIRVQAAKDKIKKMQALGFTTE